MPLVIEPPDSNHTTSVRGGGERVYAEKLCNGNAAEMILSTEELSDVETTEDEAEDSEENHDIPVMESSSTT